MRTAEHHIRSTMQDLMDGSNVPMNATWLAEDCAHRLGFDEWLDDPDHEVWEIANEINQVRNIQEEQEILREKISCHSENHLKH